MNGFIVFRQPDDVCRFINQCMNVLLLSETRFAISVIGKTKDLTQDRIKMCTSSYDLGIIMCLDIYALSVNDSEI